MLTKIPGHQKHNVPFQYVNLPSSCNNLNTVPFNAHTHTPVNISYIKFMIFKIPIL